jgi:rhodanese-related sulfurtransferase
MLEGSHGITFFDAQGRYDVNAWLDAVSRITKPNEPVVLVCELGARSIKIAQLLDQRLGFTAVHNVTEGMAGWLRQGLPVTPYKP